MIKEIPRKIKEALQRYRRTIIISRKPDKDEFASSAKITAIGILLIGLIGFIIYLVYHLIV